MRCGGSVVAQDVSRSGDACIPEVPRYSYVSALNCMFTAPNPWLSSQVRSVRSRPPSRPSMRARMCLIQLCPWYSTTGRAAAVGLARSVHVRRINQFQNTQSLNLGLRACLERIAIMISIYDIISLCTPFSNYIWPVWYEQIEARWFPQLWWYGIVLLVHCIITEELTCELVGEQEWKLDEKKILKGQRLWQAASIAGSIICKDEELYDVAWENTFE